VSVAGVLNECFMALEKLLIANGAEIFRIGGCVGKANFSRKMVVSR